MAKIKKDEIQYVRATFFYNEKTFRTYPVSWVVRAGRDVRTFESYGPNATDFSYPIERLPKAVQEFLETAVAGPPHKNFPTEVVQYNKA